MATTVAALYYNWCMQQFSAFFDSRMHKLMHSVISIMFLVTILSESIHLDFVTVFTSLDHICRPLSLGYDNLLLMQGDSICDHRFYLATRKHARTHLHGSTALLFES